VGSNRDYLFFLPNLKSSATIQVKFTCATRFLAVLYHKGKIFCFPRVIQVLYPDGRGLIFLGATAEVDGEKKTVKAERGGGMSTTKWNVVADSLLRRLNSKGLFTIGFADDLCIVIRGRDLSTISDQMRKALKIVEDWCVEQDLSVNPHKTEMMLFTRKTKVPDFRLPKLFGTQLKLTDKIKYLGVIFDPKLSFKQHLEDRVKKATMIFWQCRRTFDKTWGLAPKMVH
jgi:hypothetical protein